MSRVSWKFGDGPPWLLRHFLVLMVLGGCDGFGDVSVQGGAKGGKVHEAVDPTELSGRLVHGRRAPAQRHLPVPPAFHVAGVISIIDSIALVDRSVRASVGGTPSRPMVRVSARPS